MGRFAWKSTEQPFFLWGLWSTNIIYVHFNMRYPVLNFWINFWGFWGPAEMIGNDWEENKVILLIIKQFWSRSHLSKLDRLTPQDVYYLIACCPNLYTVPWCVGFTNFQRESLLHASIKSGGTHNTHCRIRWAGYSTICYLKKSKYFRKFGVNNSIY